MARKQAPYGEILWLCSSPQAKGKSKRISHRNAQDAAMMFQAEELHGVKPATIQVEDTGKRGLTYVFDDELNVIEKRAGR